MQQRTLFGSAPKRRRAKKARPVQPATPYQITDNDCKIFGHTLNLWSLAGTTTCMDCGVKIFCPQCIERHPQDENAVPIFCPLHEERTVSA